MEMPIRIYNRFIDFAGELDSYQSLQFGRDFHGVADFELHVNRYMHEAKKLNKGTIIALNKQVNKVGLIMTKEIALDENGKETENFKLTGYSLDGLMGRRITVPPKSTSHDRKSGNSETVMKHYVYNHFVNPVDPKRKMPHIEVAPNLNRGKHIEWESRYKNIVDELENISIKTGLGWGIFADFKTKKFIFDVIESKDLTQDNQHGNNPVFFSPEFETIKSQSFINSDNDLRNVGYVGGQGEGVERKIITIGNNTGWNRIETFVDARDVGTEDEDEGELTDEEIEQQLTDRGQSKMSEMETINTLEAEILTPIKDITPFQYEKDYDLGDEVQVVNKSWSLQMTAPITQFKEIHESGGFRLEGTFGRSRPTLISKMKNKFDELEGVEKQEVPAQIAVETKKYTDRKLTKEEQERIQQAIDNLNASKEFTEGYAEKAIPTQATPPKDPVLGDKWVDTSVKPAQLKMYDGENWNAVQGPQGVPGPPGEDGKALYTWLKYADTPTSGMSDSPNGKTYMGLAYNKESPYESNDYADYEWSLIRGEKGDQGVPGPEGENGKPTYTWVKYADDENGTGMSDYPKGKEYIGLAYNKTDQTESSNPDDYEWALIKGEKGDQGDRGEQGLRGLQGETGKQGIQGEKGADGLSTYTHIAYANSADGTVDFSRGDSTNKKYIGMFVDSNPTSSDDPSKYNWTLIKGADGSQGIPGPEGKDGNTSYLHIAYANNSTGTSGFSTTDPTNKLYIGQYTDFTQTDSTSPSRYSWSKIKGDQGVKGDTGSKGETGDTGPQGPNIVDTNTSFGVNWLVADYIKSLNGLNVGNGGFVVDGNGNVSVAGDISGSTGTFGDVSVKEGDITLEDNTTSTPYNLIPKRNLVKDHSFELIRADGDSMNQDSVDHNWLEIFPSIYPFEDSPWEKVGSPKVSVSFSPDTADSLAIFGDKAIIVRNANYVRQYLYGNGIGAGSVYTVSGHFKRQWQSAGGIPRIEIWHRVNGSRSSKIVNSTFDTVKDDYSIARHATSFTVPSSFGVQDELEVIISGGDSNWVQCDGVQMVEGDKPSVYQPEDSIWEVAKGSYRPIKETRILWSGEQYPRETQTATPSKKITDCISGWVIQWQKYTPGSGTNASNYHFTYVPKEHVIYNSPGISLEMAGTGSTRLYKYIYVYENRIVGHANNNNSPRNERAMTAVYEY